MWTITLNAYLEIATYLSLQQLQNNLFQQPKIEVYFV